ncbi:hypothetical protein [Serratia proteamaculans]|uniref:hypothetical protein n=1 Tax=Serratia proteamaculans TaxID=28151 RepID=UPI003CE7B24A
MFNRDTFWRLGEYQEKGSLADLLVKCVEAECRALVSFPENPGYYWGPQMTVRRCFSALITWPNTAQSSTATRYVRWDV